VKRKRESREAARLKVNADDAEHTRQRRSAVSPLWNRFELWARYIGFEVYRDHGAVQIGLSCGIVAGHVLTTLRQAARQADDFMTAVTTGAVDASVLRDANRVLCENVDIHTWNPFIPLHWCLPDPISGLAPPLSEVTKNLGEGGCTAVADHFNGDRPSTVHSGGYISWVSLDQAIYKIAQASGRASNSASPHHAEGFGQFYCSTLAQMTPSQPSRVITGSKLLLRCFFSTTRKVRGLEVQSLVLCPTSTATPHSRKIPPQMPLRTSRSRKT